MNENLIETRERLSRLEEKIDNLLREQKDNLIRWDRQLEKIGEIKDSVLLMQPIMQDFHKMSADVDNVKIDLHTIKTEKTVWHKILYPITGMLSAILVHLFEKNLK